MTDDEIQRARRAALSPLLDSSDFRPLSSAVRVDVAARSQQGAARQQNDDHFLVVRLGRSQETVATSLSVADVPARFEEFGYAMLVADGLGQGGVGSIASRVALSTIAHLALHYGRWNLRINPETVWDIIERAEWYYSRADAAIHERNRSDSPVTGMAAALTTAYSAGDSLFVAHVGHSRAYLFREGALIQLTHDQTINQHVAQTRTPTPIERRAQDLSHILTDAVGASGGRPTVEVEQYRLANGDAILICTNGLTDAIDEDQIADVLTLRRQSAEQATILTDLARRQGAEDNVTVILAQYQVPPD